MTAKSSLSLLNSSNISCSGSNDDLMSFCASSKGSGESAHLNRPTTGFNTHQSTRICHLRARFGKFTERFRNLVIPTV